MNDISILPTDAPLARSASAEHPAASTRPDLLTPGPRPSHRTVVLPCELLVAHVRDLGPDGFVEVAAPGDRRLRVGSPGTELEFAL